MTLPKHNHGILLNAKQVGELLNITGTTVTNYNNLKLLPEPVYAPEFKSPRWSLNSVEKFIVAGGVDAAKKRVQEEREHFIKQGKTAEELVKTTMSMTLRDAFAKEAMAALIKVDAQSSHHKPMATYALEAYCWADAMLQARQPKQEELPLHD